VFSDAQLRGAAQANLSIAKTSKKTNDIIAQSRANVAKAIKQGETFTQAQSLGREIDKLRTKNITPKSNSDRASTFTDQQISDKMDELKARHPDTTLSYNGWKGAAVSALKAEKNMPALNKTNADRNANLNKGRSTPTYEEGRVEVRPLNDYWAQNRPTIPPSKNTPNRTPQVAQNQNPDEDREITEVEKKAARKFALAIANTLARRGFPFVMTKKQKDFVFGPII